MINMVNKRWIFAIIFVSLLLISCMLLDSLLLRAGIGIILICIQLKLVNQFHKESNIYLKEQFSRLQSEKEKSIYFIQNKFDEYCNTQKVSIAKLEQALETIITQIKSRNQILPVFANQLKAVIEQTETAALNLSTSFKEINKKAKKQAGKVLNVFEQSTTTTHQNIFEDNKLVLNKLLENFLELTSHCKNFSEGIATVISNLENIKSVTDQIEEIAGLTNMLALNATIVATKAGGEAKGFTVIANEVRKLSERTRLSAENIRSNIQKILTSSEEIYMQTTKNLTESDKISSLSSIAIQTTLKEIDTQVKYLTQSFQDVQSETSSLAQDISQIVVSIQFQDITRQRIEHVIDPLMQFHQELEETMLRLQNIGKDLDGIEEVSVDKWLKQFYTMADERRIMKDTLGTSK